ncbi:hypothetical protein ACFVH6_05695 [Spirillospora sp. NPDC127200]
MATEPPVPGEKNGVPTVLTFWDTASGRSLGQARTTPQAAGHGGSETRIVWSEDGRKVASATEPGAVEFPSGRTAVRPGALTSTVTRSVQALSADGTLATIDGSRVHSVGQADGRLVTHLIAPGLLKRDLCKAAGQLSERERRTHVQDLDHRKTC